MEAFKAVQGAKVAAICSRRQLEEGPLEKQFGLPFKVYTNYETMLADPNIDVVDICTPHPLHPQQAMAAARAGKHLILEKPIALDYQDAQEIREAIKKAGVTACVCFEVRFSQQFTAIRSGPRCRNVRGASLC